MVVLTRRGVGGLLRYSSRPQGTSAQYQCVQILYIHTRKKLNSRKGDG